MLLRFLNHPRQLLHDPDNGGGGGNPQQPPTLPTDPAQAFQNALQQHQSDATRFAEQLYRENHELREQRRQLQDQVPAQGAVVLAEADAQRWAAYNQLGADVAVLGQQLAERQTLQQELAGLRRSNELRDVAAAAGYDYEVLSTLAGDRSFVIKDEQIAGKAGKVVYVKDADGKETKITEYAQQHWGKFLPSLVPGTTPSTPPRGTPAAQGQRPQPAQSQQGQEPRRLTVRL